MSEPVVFDCTCAKVQTLADNGLRVTFDLPEQAIEAAAFLMAYKAAGVVLRVSIVPATDSKR